MNELALQDNSDIENNDLEDNEDNYHQLFGASDDEIDICGFSDYEEIGCPMSTLMTMLNQYVKRRKKN